MAKVDTLTAYCCKFNYLHRNNPLLDKQRDDIKSGKDPVFSLSDFISLYSNEAKRPLIGKNTDRAICVPADNVRERKIDDANSWFVSPIAGKYGQPMTVIKQTTGKRYIFGSDCSALYNHNLFLYEKNAVIIAIFHRQNSSGCKSVFLETSNSLLQTKGLKMDMDIIVPPCDMAKGATATKITLQCVLNDASSDIADNVRKKKIVIRDIGINLEVQNNNAIAKIIRDVQLEKITKDEAFAMIKREGNIAEEYNDAEIRLKYGNRTRKMLWSEFENTMGVHDISSELHTAYKKTGDFLGELSKISDRYFHEIIESGVVDFDE